MLFKTLPRNRADKCSTQFKALTINVETTIVFTQEYTITQSIIGTGQISMFNGLCLSIVSGTKYAFNRERMQVCIVKNRNVTGQVSFFGISFQYSVIQNNNML